MGTVAKVSVAEVWRPTTMLSTMRSMLVDQEVRDKTVLLETNGDESDYTCRDPIKEVYTNGVPQVALQPHHCVTLGTSLFTDVDVHPALFEVLDHTSTKGGQACLKALLESPIADLGALQSRQKVLRDLATIMSNTAHSASIREHLAKMKCTEGDVAWVLQHPRQDEEIQELYNLAFFKMWPLRWLNRSPAALTTLNIHRIVVSPLLGLLSPLVYFVIPYLVLRFRVGLKVSFLQYMRLMRASMSVAGAMSPPSVHWAKYASLGFSLLFYFQGLFSSIEMSGTIMTVCSSLCKRTKQVEDFTASASSLVDLCSSLGGSMKSAFFPDASDLGQKNTTSLAYPEASQEWKRHMLLSNFGHRLRAFKTMDHGGCVSLMQDAYALDALVSIIDAKDRMGACDVTFEVATRPVFVADGLCHPCIQPSKSVSNSVALCVQAPSDADASASACAALLTGPNAGGKSTLLKSILLATIMAQTITIAPCKMLRLTPYSHIHSHINVPDVQGSKSLFEAEMERARESMQVLADMSIQHPQRFSLVVMDEVFSSTNPVEGIAGAYSVAKNLAESPNITLMVSTHFLFLRKLALLKREQGHPLFQLMQMPVQVDVDDERGFSYPYQLKKGVCEQLIALELLRSSGFSAQVMRDAMAVKQSLLAPPRVKNVETQHRSSRMRKGSKQKLPQSQFQG